MNFGLPRDVSLDGYRIDGLLKATNGFAVSITALGTAFLIFLLVRYSRRNPTLHARGESKFSVGWVMVVALLVLGGMDGTLFIKAVTDLDGAFWNLTIPAKNASTVRLEIDAHQWAWDVRYGGPDHRFNTPDDAVVLNDIKVPIDTPIVIELTSTDVIHNFYLPNFRVKVDAVPGHINRMWFQARSPGQFEIACSQNCGVGHYKMRGTLTVLSQPAFQQWIAEASTLSERAYDLDDHSAHWGWAWSGP